MKVDDVLNGVMDILQKSNAPLSITELKEQLNRQFRTNLDKLDVLLTLDKRFTRDDHGDWTIVESHISDESLFKLVNQVLNLREQASSALNAEKRSIEDQLVKNRNRLIEVNKSLEQLGYKPSGRKNFNTEEGEREEYSLEYHLQGLSKSACELAVQVHEAIRGLEDTEVRYNKFHIAYLSGKRYAMIIPMKSKVTIFVKSNKNFNDPKNLTRDATSRHLGLDRIFAISKPEEIEYAMLLIDQSYKEITRNRQ
jgi:predicted transport protein